MTVPRRLDTIVSTCRRVYGAEETQTRRARPMPRRHAFTPLSPPQPPHLPPAHTPVPIPAVRAPHLTAIVKFCEALAARDDALAAAADDAVARSTAHAAFASFATAWTSVNSTTLLGRTRAAHYLDVAPALDACVGEVAAALRGAAPAAVRARFGIEADLTAEEEEAIKKECAWAFDCC